VLRGVSSSRVGSRFPFSPGTALAPYHQTAAISIMSPVVKPSGRPALLLSSWGAGSLLHSRGIGPRDAARGHHTVSGVRFTGLSPLSLRRDRVRRERGGRLLAELPPHLLSRPRRTLGCLLRLLVEFGNPGLLRCKLALAQHQPLAKLSPGVFFDVLLDEVGSRLELGHVGQVIES
jgi:hypothetical protein